MYVVTASVDLDQKTIKLRENLFGNVSESIMDTKDKAIREALIALGWTPPENKKTSSGTLIVIKEKYMDWEGRVDWEKTFRIDYEKWLDWKVERSFESGYVEHIILSALGGSKFHTTGRKYSFGDCSDWYTEIQTAKPESDFEKVFSIEVEVINV